MLKFLQPHLESSVMKKTSAGELVCPHLDIVKVTSLAVFKLSSLLWQWSNNQCTGQSLSVADTLNFSIDLTLGDDTKMWNPRPDVSTILPGQLNQICRMIHSTP